MVNEIGKNNFTNSPIHQKKSLVGIQKINLVVSVYFLLIIKYRIFFFEKERDNQGCFAHCSIHGLLESLLVLK